LWKFGKITELGFDMSIQKSTIGAVLTGDIVNSTKLGSQREQELFKELLDLFWAKHPHEFYRGDSFQVYMEEPEDALRMALVCRALAIEKGNRGEKEEMDAFDIRISIAIGEVELPIRAVGTAKGEAFLLSGRRLDAFQKEERLAITCGQAIADIGLQVMADYLDQIFKAMTAKQAEVILSLMQGETQQQQAARLEKSKSTISELANAGRWPETERLQRQYKDLIKLLQ
jgi:hypothetical protein